jgi:hypothetical protein
MAHQWHGWHWGHGGHWRVTHGAIYASENRIAFLEADPEIDDGYKAPIITRARADILRLRATLHPARCAGLVPAATAAGPFTSDELRALLKSLNPQGERRTNPAIVPAAPAGHASTSH